MEINAPVDRGRKLNIHKTFRRRPGRLLNVLCTFNLRLVSTGTINFSVFILKTYAIINNKFFPAYFCCGTINVPKAVMSYLIYFESIQNGMIKY